MKVEDLEAIKLDYVNWQAQQDAYCVETATSEESPSKPQPQKLKLTKAYRDKEAVLAVIPDTAPLNGIRDGVTQANKLRLEFTMQGCDTVYRFVKFPEPVTIASNIISMPVPRGRNRVGRPQGGWQAFNPWVVFEGSKDAKKAVKDLKALGVEFIKP